MNFYPRSPRGERQTEHKTLLFDLDISIHAPREGSDTRPFYFICLPSGFLSTLPARGATTDGANTVKVTVKFLSTLPARGATGRRARVHHALKISIHAPREGSDGFRWELQADNKLISIHAPREGSDHARTPGRPGS